MSKYGIPVLVRALQHFEVTVTEEELYHSLGIDTGQLTALDLCRIAREAGLHAKWYEKINGKLLTLPLPILICLDGQWSVIEKIESDGYWFRHDVATGQLCQEPITNRISSAPW